jgi:threonine dehydrogenase-like Zn-dependent dehydrogenase
MLRQRVLPAARGADCGVEAVGYQGHDPSGEEHPELVLDNLVKAVRATDGIGVVGVYVPEDPPYAFVTVVDDTRSFWKSCIGIDSTAPAHRCSPTQRP